MLRHFQLYQWVELRERGSMGAKNRDQRDAGEVQTIVLSKLIRDLKRNHLLYLLPGLVYHFPGNDITELVCQRGIQLA